MHICLSVSSLFACLLSLVPLTTLAVSTVVDGLRIESRESSVNLETGLREYTGNVRVHYQNMIISAERLEERRRDGRVERIVSTGSPVRFDQRAPYQSGIRKAVASKAEYLPLDGTLKLWNYTVWDADSNQQRGKRVVYRFKFR